ncbi:mid region of cactin-domain-containing protein [Corynascus similis CBS 632.67]
MDPGRQAMIKGWKSPRKDRDRDITAPRYDSSNRITKTSRQPPAKDNMATAAADRYLTQDQQAEQFIADEDKFVLKQAKKKADIRVREQRAQPIDYLAFGLRFIDSDRDAFDNDEEDVEIDIPAPEAVLQSLNEAQLRELEEDIRSYHTLEHNSRNREYWTALHALCADRRQKLKPKGPEGRAVTSVASDVDRILSPKTLEQLESLEKQIKAKLQSNEPIDTDYWEELLKSLLVYKAKASLRKVCAAIKEARVEMLKARDPEKAEALAASDGFSSVVPGLASAPAKAVARTAAATSQPSSNAPPPGTARFASAGNEDFSQATKALYDREVARGVGEGEEIFSAEEAVPGIQKPLWADKYRPRKPRYFNRVLMGYEWNKYNQTHYDHDNPPPKVVQGYRFNIFYPDLIDKTKAPTFKIIREHGRRKGESFAPAGKEDTCLIRFIAGPPYEDIAFRIVDREWDYSAKKERGFKSSFDKGILQLHFQFKKIYYRK